VEYDEGDEGGLKKYGLQLLRKQAEAHVAVLGQK
jgi:hypothetical protein